MADDNLLLPADFTMKVAAAKAAGYSHVYCECCNLTAVPFRLIPWTAIAHDARPDRGQLRCGTCGKPPKEGTVAFWRFPTTRGR